MERMRDFLLVILLKLAGLVVAGFLAIAVVNILGLGVGPSLVVGFACGYLGSAIWNELLRL